MREVLYDLTNAQKSIWFTEEFYKKTPIENRKDKNFNYYYEKIWSDIDVQRT